MKKKIINFIKDFIIMLAIFCLVEFVFYKIHWIESFNIFFVLGFMLGWSIVQIIKMIKNK